MAAHNATPRRAADQRRPALPGWTSADLCAAMMAKARRGGDPKTHASRTNHANLTGGTPLANAPLSREAPHAWSIPIVVVAGRCDATEANAGSRAVGDSRR